jgi:hypothetical protein
MWPDPSLNLTEAGCVQGWGGQNQYVRCTILVLLGETGDDGYSSLPFAWHLPIAS